MKKLFSDEIYDILEADEGFIVVYRHSEVEDKVIVSYKSVNTETGVVSQRTRTDYEYVKFAGIDPNFDPQSSKFITCSCAVLEDGGIFVVSKNGDARVIDADGNTSWQGTIKYKDCGPSSVAYYGHTLWASFSERNSLIRFNLRTMREELRIGGSNDSSFSGPEGLWINEPEGQLIVCNSKANNILEVNIKTYTVRERAVFDEPVHKYLRVGNKEFAVLDSGLYLM